MHGVPRLSSRGNPALEHQKVLSPTAWNVSRPQWQGGGTRDLLVTKHPYWEGGAGGGCSLPTGPLHPPSPSSLTSHVTGHGFWEGLPPAHPRISWGRRGPLGTDDLPSPPLAGQVPSPRAILTSRRAGADTCLLGLLCVQVQRALLVVTVLGKATVQTTVNFVWAYYAPGTAAAFNPPTSPVAEPTAIAPPSDE